MKVKFGHSLQDAFGVFLMEGGVGEIDEKVIHVDDEPSFGNHVAEGVVHESLKSGGGVGKPEEHDGGFEQPFVGNEGCLPLVAIFDLYVVVSPANVKLGENFGVLQLVYEVGDEGKGVGVANGVFVNIVVVLAGAESSVLLLNEKERRGLGRIRWMNLSGCKVLV